MEQEKLQHFIDEAIQLELNIGRLYKLFADHLPEDRSFWLQLEIEEQNHAALLKASKDMAASNNFPDSLLPESLEAMQESNQFILNAHEKFIQNKDRQEAFSLGVEIEKSAGESHFQVFMKSDADDKLTKVFQKLNRFDKDHAARILNYWQNANLQ